MLAGLYRQELARQDWLMNRLVTIARRIKVSILLARIFIDPLYVHNTFGVPSV